MKTHEKINQLISELETKMAQLELEAAAANEDEAIAIVTALYKQYPKLDALTVVSDQISTVLEPRCRPEDLDNLYATAVAAAKEESLVLGVARAGDRLVIRCRPNTYHLALENVRTWINVALDQGLGMKVFDGEELRFQCTPQAMPLIASFSD